MKAPVIVLDPSMSQVRLEKPADLNKLAKKYGREVLSGPNWDFFIFDFVLYFANRKK